MPRRAVHISGSIGRWTAEADGETLPVLHTTWWNVASGEYLDPMKGAKLDGAKYTAYVERLRSCDRAIMQKDTDSVTLRRGGYVGVFRFTDLDVRQDGSISLEIVERIADFKP